MIVNKIGITIGAARREGRAATHDGECITLALDDQGRWLLEGNAGLITTNYGDSYLSLCGDDATAEDEAIQAEIEEAVKRTPDPDYDATNDLSLGHEGTECAAEWGWVREWTQGHV